MSDLPPTEKVVFRIPNGSGTTDAVLVDVCISEQHTLTNTLTDHPVENGSNITDHSRPEPRKVTLECVHSNTPLDGADGTDRARQMWQRFVDLHESPKLIALDTARDFYPSMGVESVSSSIDAKTANVLKFTVGLKEVRVVENKFTNVTVTKEPQAQKKRNLGKTNTSLVERGAETDVGKKITGFLGL